MKDQFVTYEIAKALKELGFNESCIGFYAFTTENLFVFKNLDLQGGYRNHELMQSASAPLWQQVEMWLMKQHSMLLMPQISGDVFWFELSLFSKDSGYTLPAYYSYEKAREAAILKAIELIKSN